MKFDVPNEIPVVFHNGSNYDYHFITKELANECEEKFECLGENKETHKTFSISMKKEITQIDQVHYQILLIISQKKLIKLNVKIAIVFMNMKVSRTIW